MKFSFNFFFQALAAIIQFGTQFGDFMPSGFRPWVALFVGLAQAAVAWRAHYFNPDGTQARAAYLPPQ
ncbi:MAG: hypothetical protein U0Z53_23635 [Blastocatellia bacterium]